MKRVSFEIEDYNGNTMMAFEIEVDEDGNASVTQTRDCSHADTDGDYIFDTYNQLVRIQSDNIKTWY